MFGLGDLYNGVFEEFETEAEAEQALDDIVLEWLEAAKDEIKLNVERIDDGYYGNCKYTESFLEGEDLEDAATRRVRDFHYIEKITQDEAE